MFGSSLMDLMKQIRAENIRKFYVRGLEVEVKESTDSETIDVLIRKEWKYTGFDSVEEALHFAGRKTAQIDELVKLRSILEKINDLMIEYGVDLDSFLKITREALDEKVGRPKLPLPPNFLWTSEPENELDTSSSEASEQDTEAS